MQAVCKSPAFNKHILEQLKTTAKTAKLFGFEEVKVCKEERRDLVA